MPSQSGHNTPDVMRAHCVSPSVFDSYREGKVLDDFEPSASRAKALGERGLTRSKLALKRLFDQSYSTQVHYMRLSL